MLKKIVVTGAGGFIGRNLCVALNRIEDIEVKQVLSDTSKAEYFEYFKEADIIYHLAGTNRPKNSNQFKITNTDFTSEMLKLAKEGGKVPEIIFSSSVHAESSNEYGKSKLAAESLIKEYVQIGSIKGAIYRLPGVFGKWSRPNYNSVVSTFCYNVAHEIPLEVRDPNFKLSLVYIDDVVESFISHLSLRLNGLEFFEVSPIYPIALGELAAIIKSFPELRKSLQIPNVGSSLEKRLYSTYLSYLPEDKFSYSLELKKDARGDLFEWIKSENFGQIFVSTTNPGVTRGNHFHHSKTEKFLVIRGDAEIRFRKVDNDQIINYKVSGINPTVVDIPTGYTHSITNIGSSELITLFWANEIFDPQRPDTYFLEL